MMRQMSCVFCKQEVGVPIDVIDIKNQTVLAVCDNCYLRGGRLPGLEWEVSIDGKGKVRQPKNVHYLVQIILLQSLLDI
tara:strand:+ start:279 stop:515 length:237 start_codon:yes stop_codon:yes gene_type:complete